MLGSSVLSNLCRRKKTDLELNLFVAGAFHDMQKPTMNKTKPWKNAVDESFGRASKSIAASGTADAELICAKIILPEFGRRLERKSPILPPKSPPREQAITKSSLRNAFLLCENPTSSNHIIANDKADQGNKPLME